MASHLLWQKYNFENAFTREIIAKIFSGDYMISSAFISRCPTRYILKKSYFMKMDAQNFQVPQAKSEINYIQILLKVHVI